MHWEPCAIASPAKSIGTTSAGNRGWVWRLHMMLVECLLWISYFRYYHTDSLTLKNLDTYHTFNINSWCTWVINYQLWDKRWAVDAGGFHKLEEVNQPLRLHPLQLGMDAEEGTSATHTITAGNKWTHNKINGYVLHNGRHVTDKCSIMTLSAARKITFKGGWNYQPWGHKNM